MVSGTQRGVNSKSHRLVACLVLIVGLFVVPAIEAQTRVIVRDSLGLPGINSVCFFLGCKALRGLGDPQGQLFLVTLPAVVNSATGLVSLQGAFGVLDAELDQTAEIHDNAYASSDSYLSDQTPTQYYGTTVWQGYLTQPANQLIRTQTTQSTFQVTGLGVVVADIDTGVDPTSPVLANVLIPGYDFTRNMSGGSEDSDVQASPDFSDAQSGQVNQRTVAVLDQRTVAVLDGQGYSDFGHGTMTAGLVHLVAPQAQIMPLKAFSADGTGYLSDVLRAIYFGVGNGAGVLNMSFDFTNNSQELSTAIQYATSNGVISVASAGNDGEEAYVYPGAVPSVIDVASTSNQDAQSTFTNYGAPPVFMAAPGEDVVTTYPWGTYAAGWGTSFSTPLVAGTAALMLGTNGNCSPSNVSTGLSRATVIFNPQLGWGRLDTYQAVQWCQIPQF